MALEAMREIGWLRFPAHSLSQLRFTAHLPVSRPSLLFILVFFSHLLPHATPSPPPQTPYIDVCDDVDFSRMARSLHSSAQQAGVPAVTTTGIYPGVSNRE